MIDEFLTSPASTNRRPKVENLYDVFVAMRNDEGEHIKTMKLCQEPDAQEILKSPHNHELIN